MTKPYELICASNLKNKKLKLFTEKGLLPEQVSTAGALGFFSKRLSYWIECI